MSAHAYDTALDLPRDENGRVVGYAIGREANLRDWIHRKEQASFEALCARLRARRWRISAKTDPRRGALLKATQRRYYDAHKAEYMEAQRKRRAKKYRAAPVIRTCKECGATWCRVPWLRRDRADFCSRACKAKWNYWHRKGAR